MFATSVVIYTAPGGLPQPTVEAVSGWIFIICLQTVLTGFFSQRSLRITATSDVIAVWIPWSW